MIVVFVVYYLLLNVCWVLCYISTFWFDCCIAVVVIVAIWFMLLYSLYFLLEFLSILLLLVDCCCCFAVYFCLINCYIIFIVANFLHDFSSSFLRSGVRQWFTLFVLGVC
jgi:hypothetical protein